MGGKIIVHSKVKPKPMGVWSHGVIVPAGKRMLYPGGFTSRDSQGNVVAPNDAVGQTRQIFSNIKAYLEELGATMEDIVNLTVYVTDMSDWKAMHEVRREFFVKDPPSSAMVQVVRLVEPTHKVEIVPIVMLPD